MAVAEILVPAGYEACIQDDGTAADHPRHRLNRVPHVRSGGVEGRQPGIEFVGDLADPLLGDTV